MKKSAKKSKKVKEEKYYLTPKGVLHIDFDDETCERILNILEVHARRVYQVEGGFGAIVFGDSSPEFVTIHKGK